MRSSGTFMLILAVLLVILSVSAFGVTPDNGLFNPIFAETKTIAEEEVAVFAPVAFGEIVTAVQAVDSRPVVGVVSFDEWHGCRAEYLIPGNATESVGGIRLRAGGIAVGGAL